MPLHGVDPIFSIEQMCQRYGIVGVGIGLIHPIQDMVVLDALFKNLKGFFAFHLYFFQRYGVMGF
jgi:hypothetical protein